MHRKRGNHESGGDDGGRVNDAGLFTLLRNEGGLLFTSLRSMKQSIQLRSKIHLRIKQIASAQGTAQCQRLAIT